MRDVIIFPGKLWSQMIANGVRLDTIREVYRKFRKNANAVSEHSKKPLMICAHAAQNDSGFFRDVAPSKLRGERWRMCAQQCHAVDAARPK